MPQQDLVILFPIWACMALVTLVLTQAGTSPHLTSLGRGAWFPQGSHLNLVTQVLIWASWDLVSQFHIGASPGPSDSCTPLGLTLKW